MQIPSDLIIPMEGGHYASMELLERYYPGIGEYLFGRGRSMHPVTSSHVHSIGYDYVDGLLFVRYSKDNGQQFEAAYGSISISQAVDFFTTYSQGIWIWDYIRVRGKGNFHEHQVPYYPGGVVTS